MPGATVAGTYVNTTGAVTGTVGATSVTGNAASDTLFVVTFPVLTVEFTDEVVNRPDVKKMIEKIDFVVDDEAERAGYHKMTTIIDIHLKDGRTVSGRADFGKGSPSNPMSYDEAADKFRECAEFARWDESSTEQIVETVRKLETLDSVRHLTKLLARPESAS